MTHLWEFAKYGFVLRAIKLVDQVGVIDAIAAVFYGTLHRAQRLRPLTILATIPEEPVTVRCTDQRHGAAVRGAKAVGQRRSILKQFLGDVTRRAGDLSVGTEACV